MAPGGGGEGARCRHALRLCHQWGQAVPACACPASGSPPEPQAGGMTPAFASQSACRHPRHPARPLQPLLSPYPQPAPPRPAAACARRARRRLGGVKKEAGKRKQGDGGVHPITGGPTAERMEIKTLITTNTPHRPFPHTDISPLLNASRPGLCCDWNRQHGHSKKNK